MKRIKYFIYILISISICIVSCKKAQGPDLLLYVTSPTIQEIATKETTISVDWDYAQDSRVVGFVAQLSLDKNFTTIFQSDTVDANSRTVDFENVTLVTEYFVRVRALASNMVISSDFAVKSLKLESVFLPTVRSDVKANQAILKWTAPSSGSVSNIILLKEGIALAPIQLSSTDITNRTITITGLSDATLYTALIYDGEERKGVITFTTRDINEKITINASSIVYETLQEAVNAAVSGDVINFGPASYQFPGETVTIEGKSLTLQPIANSNIMPAITLRNFDLKGAVSNLKISGLKIISSSFLDKTGNTDYNKHIIGASYVTGPLNVIIENSDLSGAESGLIFTQTVGAASAPSPVPGTGTFQLSISNSLLHDFGNAGGDFIDFRSGTVGTISLRNSTFWNGARAFIRIDATAAITAGSTITLENSTFYKFCNGGIFLRNAVTATPASFILNKNIIMDKVSNNGNSIGTGSTLKLNTNNISGTNAANITGGVTTGFNIGTTSLDPAFANPAGGNFTVGNATLKAAAVGDPRWL